jgi:hypothetical protein
MRNGHDPAPPRPHHPRDPTDDVVEVSFEENNPIHRAVMCCWRLDGMTLFGGGYGHPIIIHRRALKWFRIVEEILAMDCDYPNHFKLPREVRT